MLTTPQVDGLRALVIDDNGLIAIDTREMLIELGFAEVEVASRAEEAVDRLHADAFDWAIVDGTLRGGALDQVVATLDHKGVPFVFVSSLPDGSDIAVGHAGRTHLARPYAKKDLAALFPRSRD